MTSKSKRNTRATLPELHEAGKTSSKADITVFTESLIQAVANMPDGEQARAMAVEWAGHQFDIAFGRAMAAHRRAAETLSAERERLVKELSDLRRELKQTPARIYAASAFGGTDEKPVRSLPLWKWRLSHQIEALLSFGGFLVICYTSFAVTKANLSASGVPAFVDDTTLAALIAAMPPAAALAIKSIGSIFWRATHRAAFRLTVYLGAAVSFACWLWFFAHEYTGLSGAFDPFAVQGGKSALFTIFQLGSEVFVGAALFLRAERISEHYAPDFRVWNVEHDDLTKQIAAKEAELKDVEQKLEEASGQLTELTAARAKLQLEITVAVQERIARFVN